MNCAACKHWHGDESTYMAVCQAQDRRRDHLSDAKTDHNRDEQQRDQNDRSGLRGRFDLSPGLIAGADDGGLQFLDWHHQGQAITVGFDGREGDIVINPIRIDSEKSTSTGCHAGCGCPQFGHTLAKNTRFVEFLRVHFFFANSK